MLAIFLEVISLSKKHFKALIKVTLPLVIVYTISIFRVRIPSDENGEPLFTLLNVSVFLVIWALFIIIFPMAVVGVHRIFLLKTIESKKLGLFNWTGNEFEYGSRWGAIALASSFMAFLYLELSVYPIFSLLIDNSTVDEGNFLTTISTLLAEVLMFYWIARWSLILPSSAIGLHEVDFQWAWQISKGNSWRLMILVSVIPFLLNHLLSLRSEYDSMVYSFLFGVIGLVAGVVQIGILSLSYAHLVQIKREESSNRTLM